MRITSWSSLWDTVWWLLTVFVFVAYLMALIGIIGDLFRDRELQGLHKALWLVFLVFLPFITILVYLIVRGNGMSARAEKHLVDSKTATDDYIRSVAGGAAGEIAQAKQLLDSGAITQEEYAQLRQGALTRSSCNLQCGWVRVPLVPALPTLMLGGQGLSLLVVPLHVRDDTKPIHSRPAPATPYSQRPLSTIPTTSLAVT